MASVAWKFVQIIFFVFTNIYRDQIFFAVCFYHVTYSFRVNLHSVGAWMSRNSLLLAVWKVVQISQDWTKTVPSYHKIPCQERNDITGCLDKGNHQTSRTSYSVKFRKSASKNQLWIILGWWIHSFKRHKWPANGEKEKSYYQNFQRHWF